VSPPIRLTPVEFMACWEALELGEPPFLLRMLSPSGTEEMIAETRRRLRAALGDLTERGLVDGSYPSGQLSTLLRTFAGAEHQLDIRFTGTAARPVLGLGARRGAQGVVILSNDGAGPIDLYAMDATRVDTALIGLLGTVEPGTAPQVNIPADVLDAAAAATRDGNPWTLSDKLRARGIPGGDASGLARMLGPADLGGQLGVTTQIGGRQQRGPWVIGFSRGKTGYFMQLRRDNTVTISPTDGNRLLRSWRDLVTHLPTNAY